MTEYDQVMAPLSVDFVRLMRNWAQSRAGVVRGRFGFTMSSIYEGPIRYDRSPEATVPVLEGEAADVRICLRFVPPRYGQAVELFWDHEGAPFKRLAVQCGKEGVDHHTFRKWVMYGHEALDSALQAYRAGCRQRHEAARAMHAGA